MVADANAYRRDSRTRERTGSLRVPVDVRLRASHGRPLRSGGAVAVGQVRAGNSSVFHVEANHPFDHSLKAGGESENAPDDNGARAALFETAHRPFHQRLVGHAEGEFNLVLPGKRLNDFAHCFVPMVIRTVREKDHANVFAAKKTS